MMQQPYQKFNLSVQTQNCLLFLPKSDYIVKLFGNHQININYKYRLILLLNIKKSC